MDKEFWRRRLKEALSYRKTVVPDADACRIVFSESDFIPGLIVDRYGDHLVMQTLSLGAENLIEIFKELLQEELKPKSIILRNDVSVRRLEGLQEEKKVLFGEKPDLIEVQEGGVKYLVDIWEGHKTGSYLDQRENRLASAKFSGKRALDLFSYQGGFSLHLAKNFDKVTSVESSQSAVSGFKKNMELNNIRNIEIISENGFDVIKTYSKNNEKFDLIVLDPPAFAKSKKDLNAALRGYKELNLRAIQALEKGGILITNSCSYNIGEEDFTGIIADAASDAKRNLNLIEKRIQSPDHPVRITFPESFYLKCLVFRVVD